MSEKWYDQDMSFKDMKKHFKNINWIPAAIVGGVLAIIVIVVWLFVAFYEGPLKEGYVTELHHDEEHVGYHSDRKTVERPEQYLTTETYTVDGKVMTRTVWKTRWVFDHYEYCVEKHLDGEDFFIKIELDSEKHEGKLRSRYFYIPKGVYKELEDGDYFYFDKERDTIKDRNNKITRVTEWAMTPYDMDPWKVKEY